MGSLNAALALLMLGEEFDVETCFEEVCEATRTLLLAKELARTAVGAHDNSARTNE